MKSKNLLGVATIFFGFGPTGCDALTGERYPIPLDNYEVPQTRQLHIVEGIILLTRLCNKAPSCE
ncbi:MAG: hypothetical protein HN867_04275 [Deltaproteobacteria bacterium]|jgi:hypothetical protein|nr:hypothetical protein [Deltaproteobacteria bacterium]MBT7202693.1 hypothetical protein [Deltaproteobacteria bacterium]